MRFRADDVARDRAPAAPLGDLGVHPPLRRLTAAVAVVVALAGCGEPAHTRTRPVRFVGIDGYLVTPAAHGRHPSVVLVHGAGGDRGELLPQAVAFARDGVVALTITEPSTAHPLPRATTLAGLLDGARRTQERDTAAVRAAAVFLGARPDVVPGRIGYLGWSAGAKTGAFVTERFRALALLSAGAATVDQFAAAAPPAVRPLVRRSLGTVDPVEAIARARPGSLLLEDGRRDAVVPRAALLNVVRAAPRGTVVRWYDTGHALDARAYADARRWLEHRLLAHDAAP